MAASQTAAFRERQAVEEASACLGLNGSAIVASHEAINARATRGAARILRLVEQGRHAEAQACLDAPDWGLAEDGENEDHPRRRSGN